MTRAAKRIFYSIAVVLASAVLVLSGWNSALAYVVSPPGSLSVLHKVRSSAVVSLGVFTGNVEEIGTIVDIQERGVFTTTSSWDGSFGGVTGAGTGAGTGTGIGTGIEWTIRGNSTSGVVIEGSRSGCSICVNGVRMTATGLDPLRNEITVALGPEESLETTRMLSLQRGQAVNLERASGTVGGGKDSGSSVRGRIDGTGTIVDQRVDGDGGLRITVRVDERFVDGVLRRVVPKGLVAVDGVLLTVAGVDPLERIVCGVLAEYAQKKVVPPQKSIGEKVNIEVDILGEDSESATASLLSRLEALEAKVALLERRLLHTGGSNGRKHSKSFERATKRISPRHRRMIKEATPNFGNYVQEGTPGYTNPSLSVVRKKKDGDSGEGVRFVTIQGSF